MSVTSLSWLLLNGLRLRPEQWDRLLLAHDGEFPNTDADPTFCEQQAFCESPGMTRANCKALVLAYGKAQELQMKWKNGRFDQTKVTMYTYCRSHAECGFAYKHDCEPQEGSNVVQHDVSCKGTHAAGGRQVRGTDVVLRAKADEMTKSHTAMGAYAEMVKHGEEIEGAPSKECLQRARRRQKRVRQEQVQVQSDPSLVEWLDHLENLELRMRGIQTRSRMMVINKMIVVMTNNVHHQVHVRKGGVGKGSSRDKALIFMGYNCFTSMMGQRLDD